MAADKTFEAYESIAEESLARFTTQPVQHLVGGERRSSLDGSTFENMSPVDGRPLGTIASYTSWAVTLMPQPKRQPMHSRSGRARRVRSANAFCIVLRISSLNIVTRSQPWSASILAKPSDSCRRLRCEAPRTSGFLLTTLLQHQMAGRCPINIM